MLQEIEGSAQVKDFFLNTSAHLVKVIIQNRQELPSFVNFLLIVVLFRPCVVYS